MKPPAPTPEWKTFRVPKHAPDEAHLSGLYCLAAAAWWLLRDDESAPTVKAILKAMKATLPPTVARTGMFEKHLRQAADIYGLAIFRCGAGGRDEVVVEEVRNFAYVRVATVRGLAVPEVDAVPEGRRYVVVAGPPDREGRFPIVDPHPGVSARYKVAEADFREAWAASATKTHKPSLLDVWRPKRWE